MATIRPASPDDLPEILAMIRELAAFEEAEHEAVATLALLELGLFGPHPAAHAHVAEGQDGLLGFALWHHNFSTWLGRPGIWLEDLYVRPAARGLGLGRALLAALAAEVVALGGGRLDFNVLDWNPARDFYARLGSERLESWTVHRLTGQALAELAAEAQA